MQINTLQFTATKVSFCPLNLAYANHNLVKTYTVKLLGLQWGSHLTCKTCIYSLLNKFGTVCFVTRRLSYILNSETLRVVYFAHFHTLAKHCIILWSTSTTKHKIFWVRIGIVRIMLGIGPRSSCRN